MDPRRFLNDVEQLGQGSGMGGHGRIHTQHAHSSANEFSQNTTVQINKQNSDTGVVLGSAAQINSEAGQHQQDSQGLAVDAIFEHFDIDGVHTAHSFVTQL